MKKGWHTTKSTVNPSWKRWKNMPKKSWKTKRWNPTATWARHSITWSIITKGLPGFWRCRAVPWTTTPLNNNAAEQLLKKCILLRKNALFYKTKNGSRVSDILMSLIQTSVRAGENPYQYLVALQRHRAHVLEHPGDWLPWNYRATITALAVSEAAWTVRFPLFGDYDTSQTINLSHYPIVAIVSRKCYNACLARSSFLIIR